ncbi:transposase [Larkinella insperata]|uniref:Transposase n=1 Tax=Larkinella insperata TaxID=332158 RepID=A0ABW3QJI9_9BACT|nr:transposase [Larkinella insperata]
MRKYELTDSQWEKLKDMMPSNNRPGRPWRSHRQSINGILWILNSGAPWRDLPERYGSWKTIYDRFRRWQRDGTLAKILTLLQLNFPAVTATDNFAPVTSEQTFHQSIS